MSGVFLPACALSADILLSVSGSPLNNSYPYFIILFAYFQPFLLYIKGSEPKEYDEERYVCIEDPNKYFYAIARILGMSEEDIIFHFYVGVDLSILEYGYYPSNPFLSLHRGWTTKKSGNASHRLTVEVGSGFRV